MKRIRVFVVRAVADEFQGDARSYVLSCIRPNGQVSAPRYRRLLDWLEENTDPTSDAYRVAHAEFRRSGLPRVTKGSGGRRPGGKDSNEIRDLLAEYGG